MTPAVLRFTVRNLLVLVGVVAIGIAAMRDASELAERAAFSAMLLTLVIALVGAIVTRGEPRWVGFTVFGWIYATFTFVQVGGQNLEQHLLTTGLIDRVLKPLLAIPHDPGNQPPPGAAPNMQGMGMMPGMAGSGMNLGGAMGGMPPPPTPEQAAAWNSWFNAYTAFQNRMTALGDRYPRAQIIGHAILALLIAAFGAVVGQFLTRFRQSEPSPNPPSGSNGTVPASPAHALAEP